MQSPPDRIDAHAHVFAHTLPMAPERRYTPAHDAPVADYLRRLDENGMTHGVLVQPSFLGTDNSFLLESLKAAPLRLRGIAVLEATTPAEEFDRLDAAGVVGARLNLVGGAPLPDFSAADWRRFLANIARKNWQIEVQRAARDALRIAPGLLDAGINVVLDHFALPDPTLGAGDPAWRALLAHGETGRLWVKVSAPYRSGPQGRAIARACYCALRDSLGPERLMWGSDWPHTQFETSETYEGNRAFFEELVLDGAVRARVLASARGLFKF